jgi:osmotically-inducible protein OsmY
VELELRTTVRLRDSDIKVMTSHGIVTLRGTVEGLADRLWAEQLCQRIDGVASVRNDLMPQLATAALGNLPVRAEQRFARDYLLRDNTLSVRASNGVATLTGKVDSWYEKYHAERIVRGVPGVITVRNEVHVRPTISNVGSNR